MKLKSAKHVEDLVHGLLPGSLTYPQTLSTPEGKKSHFSGATLNLRGCMDILISEAKKHVPPVWVKPDSLHLSPIHPTPPQKREQVD